MVFDPRTPGIVPDPEDELSISDRVLNMIFGDPNDPNVQAAVPNPRQLLPFLIKGARSLNLGGGQALSKIPGIGNLFKAGGKAVNNPLTGKFVPNASVTGGVNTLVKGAANVVRKGAGSIKSGAGKIKDAASGNVVPAAIIGGALNPGAVGSGANILSTGVTAARGVTGQAIEGIQNLVGLGPSEEELAANQTRAIASIPGLPSPRQEVISEVSTRSGMNVQEGPADREAKRLQGLEDRRQAAEDSVVRQAGLGVRAEGISSEITEQRQNIAEQIAGLRQAPAAGRDEFSQRLAALLGTGLPSAITGHGNGIQLGAQMSNQIGSQFASQRAQTAAQMKALQGRADKLLGVQITALGRESEIEGKVGTQLAKESAEFSKVIEETRKAEDEGRLDATRSLDVGGSRFDTLDVSMHGDKLFRQAGAKELKSADQKILSGLVRTAPVIQGNLRTLQRIIAQVGVTGDAALSEPVTIVDPRTGEEKEFTNAAAAMETLSTLFKANVKDIENLGALGQDVLQFTSALMDDPTGYLTSIKDWATQGGQTGKIVQQVDVLVDNYTVQAETFFDANEIKSLSRLNADKLDNGEVPGFSRIAEDQLFKDHPERTVKMVDPDDGKVFYLTPEEYNQVMKNSRKRR